MEAQTIFSYELENKNIHLVALNLNDNDISVIRKAIRELRQQPEDSFLMHEIAYMLNQITKDLSYSGYSGAEKCQ